MRTTSTSRLAKVAGAAGLLLALGACATLSAPPAPDFDALMSRAATHADAGRADAAVGTLEQAAALESSSKVPWLRIAQLRAAQGRHIDALAAAEQVLRRDPTDAVAHQVTVDSGLAVAVRTLQRLRAAGQAIDDNRQAQGQALATLMFEVFGPGLVVPEAVKARIAEDAIDLYRASRVKRLPDAQKPQPKGDPLDLLGGD